MSVRRKGGLDDRWARLNPAGAAVDPSFEQSRLLRMARDNVLQLPPEADAATVLAVLQLHHAGHLDLVQAADRAAPLRWRITARGRKLGSRRRP